MRRTPTADRIILIRSRIKMIGCTAIRPRVPHGDDAGKRTCGTGCTARAHPGERETVCDQNDQVRITVITGARQTRRGAARTTGRRERKT